MKRCKFSIIRMCEMAFLMQAVGIWATKLHMKPGAFQNLLGLIVPTGKWTSFPLTLWIVYPALGMLFGKYLEKCEDKDRMYRNLMFYSMVFFAVYTVGLLYTGFDIRENYALYKDSYYHHNIISTLWTLPIIILALSICHFLFGKLEQTKLGEFIRYLSENLNTIYIIQWLIIAYSVAISILLGIDKTYSSIIIIIGGIIVTFVAVILSIPFVRIKRNRKMKTN